MKRTIIVLVLILLLPTFQVNAFAYSNIPENIKIGLYFGYKAVSKVNISSDTGLSFGYENDNKFMSIYSDPRLKSSVVIKDSYYIKSNNSIDSSNSDEVSIGDIGPYHIQIGDDINKLEKAKELLVKYSEAEIQVFLMYYNGVYKIWTGSYINKSNAQGNIDNLKDITKEECRVIEPGAQRILVMSNDCSRIVFAFDGSKQNFLMSPLESAGDSVIKINGKPYRGAVGILRLSHSDMTVINFLDLEEYLYGVLPREMGGHWPLEALKAQAVAARTYAIRNMGRFKDYGFNLCPTTSCQVYSGYGVETSRTTQAVNETKGKILTYNGKPAYTYYFATSGGHTENVNNVWGGSLPYLTGVEDPYENTKIANRGYWKVEMSSNDIKQKLMAQGIDLGDIVSVVPTKYSEAGRVIELTITGTSGKEKFTKSKTRNIFGTSVIYSQCYTVESDNNICVSGSVTDKVITKSTSNINVISSDGISSISSSSNLIYAKNPKTQKPYSSHSTKYLFNGKGYGHGVGLSQWGARGMAESGFEYDEIILHYFPGTILE